MVALAERAGRTDVRMDLTLTVIHPGPGFPDDIAAVMSYEGIIEDLRRLCAEEAVPGSDYLAEHAADLCLAHARVQRVRVDVALPVAADAAAAGTSLTRRQNNPP